MYEAMLKRNEGVRTKVYKDSLGIPTVAVGFNLKRLDARERLAEVGAVYEDVLLGKALTLAQVDKLLAVDIAECLEDLLRLFPDFDTLPPGAKQVLVDLRFNLGGRGLRGFSNTLAEFRARRFSTAGDRLAKSLWAKQVGRRAVENIALLKSLGDVKLP